MTQLPLIDPEQLFFFESWLKESTIASPILATRGSVLYESFTSYASFCSKPTVLTRIKFSKLLEHRFTRHLKRGIAVFAGVAQ
jgi:hypothetical protein